MITAIKGIIVLTSVVGLSSVSKAPNIKKAIDYATIDATDKQVIENYDFTRTLPPPRNGDYLDHLQNDFGYVDSYNINFGNFTGTDYHTTVSFFKKRGEAFHYKMIMKTQEGKVYTLFDKVDTSPSMNVYIYEPCVIHIPDILTWANFSVYCYTEKNPQVKNESKFFLSKPGKIIATSQEVRIAWEANLRSGKSRNPEIRLEFYNLKPLLENKYYFRVPVYNLYVRGVNSRYIGYDDAGIFIKDDHGYFKHCFKKTSPLLPGYYGNYMMKNHLSHINNLTLFVFDYSFFTDLKTHMSSDNKYAFEHKATCTQFFMPKGKYELYKEIDCAFTITNMYSLGIDIIFPFKVNFLNPNVENSAHDKRSETTSDAIYQNLMKEEIV